MERSRDGSCPRRNSPVHGCLSEVKVPRGNLGTESPQRSEIKKKKIVILSTNKGW